MVSDEARIARAMELAAAAAAAGDVPVGAVLVVGDRVFEAFNEKERRADPTAHAEMLAIRAAAQALGRWRLAGAQLYVSKEPCTMCAGAIVAARIERLVFGAHDRKGGAAGGVLDAIASNAANHHVIVVGGVYAVQTAAQLRTFFDERRS